MTIAIKLLMFPLTKTDEIMSAMQKFSPRPNIFKEKYKDDPQLMQQKIMEMYKEQGVSPFGGCLPLLIQMPIFIAFYQSLFNFKLSMRRMQVFVDTQHSNPIHILFWQY